MPKKQKYAEFETFLNAGKNGCGLLEIQQSIDLSIVQLPTAMLEPKDTHQIFQHVNMLIL